MTQTAIPLQFETYMRNQIAVGQPTDMNEMIFANIPGLDPGIPIDRTQGLPDPQYWVHQQNMDQVGKLGDNSLVHSVVIANDVAEFTFNAIYMHDKTTPNSCGMVVHTVDQTKLVGQALTKSLLQQYLGAAQIANIIIDAATWQIDYSARLNGIDEDHRLSCLDNYGHTAYVDGFDVTRQGDPTKYKVMPGVVYIGGLRAVLADELLLTITNYPNGIYVDVHRDGSPTSKWVNLVEVKVSTNPLADYVDPEGRQHYVARLAGIEGGGLVEDWRKQAVRPSETQVVNRVLGNQNANVAGKDNHPVPSDTEYTYPAGQEIAAGWLAVTECVITKVGKELSGTGTYRRTIDGEFPNDYFALKRVGNSQDQTGIELTAETGKTHLDVDLAEAGAHMFPASSEIEGVFASVGDEESRTSSIDFGNGEDYIDPDAIGANPVAKIWPDGTITGSTDNGSYTKYPDGTARIFLRNETADTATTSLGSLYLNDSGVITAPFPIELLSTGYKQATVVGSSGSAAFASQSSFISTDKVDFNYRIADVITRTTNVIYVVEITIEGFVQ